jgi:hypothetical protein
MTGSFVLAILTRKGNEYKRRDLLCVTLACFSSGAVLLSFLPHHLSNARGHHLNERRRFLWLPVLGRFFWGYGPRLCRVNDCAGGFCCLQYFQRLMDHAHLLRCILGLAKRVTKGELDRQCAWHADLFCPEGHICHHNRGEASGVQRSCQHGHVSGAIWSGGGEQHAVHPRGFELLSYLRAIDFLPGGSVRRKALVSHKRVGVFCQTAYASLDDQLPETMDG